MQEGLSLDQAPPFRAPLRFFLTAPLFAVLAGAGLAAAPEILSSRWHQESIGSIHLLTLGFITMTISGAMMQMLPVIAGKTVKRPLFFAAVIHSLLSLGTALFFISFYLHNLSFLVLALFGVFTALLYFFIYTATLILRTEKKNDTIRAMAFSLISLFFVIASGFLLGLFRAGVQIPLQIEGFSDIHIAWALIGWTGILIFGVSYQVFPMFYIAPPLQAKIKSYFVPALFLTLVSWTFVYGNDGSSLTGKILSYAVSVFLGGFAVLTLWLFFKRKRKAKEAGVPFFLLGFSALALSALLFHAYSGMTAAVLYLYGFSVSIINGMMYRIIPFLTYFHISAHDPMKAPTMKKILPDKFARAQFYLHAAALFFLIASNVMLQENIFEDFSKEVSRSAGVLIAASNLFLFINLFRASRFYFRFISGMSEKDSAVLN